MFDEPPVNNPGEFFEGSDGEQPATPVALVSTLEPLSLSIDEVDDDRIPDGMACMASFLGGRLIARCAVTPDWLTEIRNRDLFADPVRIALAAVEQEPGLQCRLFALLPAELFQTNDEPDEPWSASVPRFEEAQPQTSEEAISIRPILLGNIVRFHRDRKHPDDLAAEAADILQSILADDRPLSNIVDKLLDEL